MTLLVRRESYHIAIEARELYKACPEKLTGHPDTWHPGDGAEIEFLSAYIIKGDRIRRVSVDGIINALDRRSEYWQENAEIMED